MIISIHIPKAGGSSLRQVLHGVYGAHLWADYSRQWSPSDAHLAEIPESARCLHGHFEADAFKVRFPNARLITWMRNPVDRIVSLYRHILHRPDLENSYIREIHQRQPGLVEFSQIPWVRNHAFNYLKGFSPEDFTFIGFLEDFASSLRSCARKLGWPDIPEPTWENKAGDCTPPPPADQLQFLRENNREEMQWYEQARSCFPAES